jgi:hypothetical protein
MPTTAKGIENTNDRRNELIKILFGKLWRRRTSLLFASCFLQFRGSTIFRVENREDGGGRSRRSAIAIDPGPLGLNFCPILFFWDVRMGYF